MSTIEIHKIRPFNEIFRNSTAAFILRCMGAGFNLLFSIMVAQKIGAHGTGVFYLALAMALAATIPTRLGMDNILVRMSAMFNINNEAGLLKDLYYKSQTLSLLLSVGVCTLLAVCIQIVFGSVLDKGHLIVPLSLSVLITPFLSSVILQGELLRGLKRITLSYWLIAVLPPLLACIYVHISHFESANEVIKAYTLIMAGMSVLGHICILRLLGSTPRNKGAVRYGQLLRGGLPLLMVSSMDIVIYWAALFVLQIYSSSAEVGIFGTAYRIASVMIFSLTAVNSISRTKYAENFHTGDHVELTQSLRWTNVLLLLGTLPLLIIILAAPEFILGLFGEQFVQGSASLRLLSVGVFLYCVTGTYPLFILMRGNDIFIKNITHLSIVLAVILNIMLIPAFGMNGAVFATSGCMLFQNISAILFKRFNFSQRR